MNFFKKIKKLLGFSKLSEIAKTLDKELKKGDLRKWIDKKEDFLDEIVCKIVDSRYSNEKIKSLLLERVKYWAKYFNKCRNAKEFEISIFCCCLIELKIKILKKTFFILIKIRCSSNFLSYWGSINWTFIVSVIHCLVKEGLIDENYGLSLLKSYLIMLGQSKSLTNFKNGFDSVKEAFSDEIDGLIEDLDDRNKSKIESKLSQLDKIIISESKSPDKYDLIVSNDGPANQNETIINEKKDVNEGKIIVKEDEPADKDEIIVKKDESDPIVDKDNIRKINTDKLIEILNKNDESKDQEIMALLKEDVDINAKNKDGETLLMYAIKTDKSGILEFLLNHEAIKIDSDTLIFAIDQNKNDFFKKYSNISQEDNLKLLMYAIKKSKLDTVVTLLDCQDVKIDFEILILAIDSGEDYIFEELFKKTPKDIKEGKQKNGLTLLMYAIQQKNLQIVKILVADKDIKISFFILIFAIDQGDFTIFEILFGNAEENVKNEKNENGYTLLMYAVIKKKKDIVEILLLDEVIVANVNEKNSKDKNKTALNYAENNDEEIKALLMEIVGQDKNEVSDEKNINEKQFDQGKNCKDLSSFLDYIGLRKIDDKDAEGNTPLIFAVADGQTDMVKVIINTLIDRGLDVNEKNADGDTPLSLAIEYHKKAESEQMVDEILKSKKTEISFEELILAINKNRNNIVEKLLENTKESVKNQEDKKGLTLLMNGVIIKNIAVVETLLRDDVILKTINKKNSKDEGKTVLDYVYDNKPMEDLLVEKGAMIDPEKRLYQFLRSIDLVEIDDTDENGTTPLIWAAYEGELDVVKILINLKVDVNSKDKNERTALMYSVYRGELDIVKILINYTSSLNEKDKDGDTVLTISIKSDKEKAPEIVDELLKSGKIKINFKDLILAINYNKVNIFKKLLKEAKENVKKEKDSNGHPLLFIALDKENIDILETLLKDKVILANVNEKDGNDLTPLMFAVIKRNIVIVQMLLENEVILKNINEKNSENKTAMDYVRVSNDKKDKAMENLLIQKGANVSDEIKLSRFLVEECITDKLTPLMYAVWRHNLEILKILIKRELDVNEEDKNGNTALAYAIDYGKKKVVEIVDELLKSKSIEINLKELILTIDNNQNDILKKLLDRAKKDVKNEIWEKDKKKYTLIMYATNQIYAKQNVLKIIDTLLNDKEIEINLKDLIFAIDQDEYDIFEKLWKHADTDIKNKKDEEGFTPLMYVVKKKKKNIVKILLADPVIIEKINEQNRQDQNKTALDYAELDYVDNDSEEIKALLIAKGANFSEEGILSRFLKSECFKKIDDKLGSGTTALMQAAYKGRPDIVRTLINRGLYVNAKNEYKETALSYAIYGKEKTSEIVDELLKSKHIKIKFKDLILAINYNKVNILEKLLKKAKDEDKYELLRYATDKKKLQTLEMLLNFEEISEILDKKYDNKTAFHYIINNIDNKKIENLVIKKREENDEKQYKKLILAIENNNTSDLKNLLKNSEEISKRRTMKGKNTLLMYGVTIGNEETVETLLDDTAIEDMINDKNENEETALILAIKHSKKEETTKEIVKILLEVDIIKLDVLDNLKNTALMYAAKKGMEDVVKILMSYDERGLSQYTWRTNKDGKTLLMLGSSNQKKTAGTVSELLKSTYVMSTVSVKNRKDGKTAKDYAEGNEKIIKLLEECEKKFEEKVDDPDDPIEKKLAEFMANYPALKDIYAEDKNENTTLMLAVNEGNLDVVKILISDQKIKINGENKDGDTALALAIKSSKKEAPEIADKLLDLKNIEVNLQDLTVAIDKNKNDILEKLLKKAKPEVKKKTTKSGFNDGFTILMYAACKEDQEDTVETLLADKDIKTIINEENTENKNKTALMYAISSLSKGVVKILLKCPEVKEKIKDKDQAQKLLYYAKYGGKGIEELIKLNCSNSTELMFAVSEGNINLVEDLINKELENKELNKRQMNINAKNDSEDTALSIAIKSKNEKEVKMVIINKLLGSGKIIIRLDELILAIDKNENDILEELLLEAAIQVKEATTECKGKKGFTILMYASAMKKTNKGIIETLLKQPCIKSKINEKNRNDQNKTALIYAILANNKNVVEMLLKRQEVIANKDNKIEELLNHAKYADEEIKELLKLYFSESTDLMFAVSEDNVELVEKLILDSGKNNATYINKKNNAGYTALFYAVGSSKKNASEIVKKLLEVNGIEISLKELILAIDDRKGDILEELLSKAKPEVKEETTKYKGKDGFTIPMYLTAKEAYGGEDILKVLLADKNIIEIINAENQPASMSALMYAIENENINMVKTLLEYQKVKDDVIIKKEKIEKFLVYIKASTPMKELLNSFL